jgi:Mlc titration factor MtfA (ptsG expression regulator)
MSESLQAAAAIALVFVTMALAYWLGRKLLPLVRLQRPVRLLREPVPGGWAEIVRGNIPLTLELEPYEFQRLLKLVQAFLAKKRVEGAGGLEMTEEIRVTVAALACFLLLRLEVGLYEGLRTVIVYPHAVRRKRMRRDVYHDPEDDVVLLGESWQSGVVVLSWDSVKHGAFDPRDGKNVALHEFAHQLDQEAGAADGVPAGFPLSALKPWAELLDDQFSRRDGHRKARPVMDAYGMTNRAEFFAVATESFFEKPWQLRAREPEVYDALSRFYGFDPAEGLGMR